MLKDLVSMMVCLIIVTGAAKRQTIPKSASELSAQFSTFSRKHPRSTLYIHTDRSVYRSGETIWCSGYLTRKANIDLKGHHFLVIQLIDPVTKSVRISKKLAMQEGIASGSLDLTDGLPSGEYQLLAFTNVVGSDMEPVAVFRAPLFITDNRSDQAFSITASMLDLKGPDSEMQVKISLNNIDKKEASDAQLSYRFDNGSPPIERRSKGKETIISIPKTLNHRTFAKILISVRTKDKKASLIFPLPSFKRPSVKMRFFPEGGDLVEGASNLVGVETTADGIPKAMTGYLYSGDRLLDTIRTSSTGMGRFLIEPKAGITYHVKLKIEGAKALDTTFILPKALTDIPTIHLLKAVVKDTVKVQIASKVKRPVKVLVHDQQNLYACFDMMSSPSSRPISIAVNALPKGPCLITVLNDDGKPVAERLFFAHYDQKAISSINTSKNEYDKRSTVKLKIKLTDQQQRPVKALFSLACVRDADLWTGSYRSIESYVNAEDKLDMEMGLLPNAYYENENILEDVLLIRGWRKFKWQDVNAQSLKDTLPDQKALEPKAIVTHGKKALRRPVGVSLMTPNGIDVRMTNANGELVISDQQMLLPDDRYLSLMINEKDKEGYEIKVDDPYSNIKVSPSLFSDTFAYTRRMPGSDLGSIVNTKLDRTIQLDAVSVRSSAPYGGALSRGKPGANECGDYVDEYGYLNYPKSINSDRISQPVKGRQYKVRTDLDGDRFTVSPVTYEGCTTDRKQGIVKIPGIYYAREFYGVDLKRTAPQYLSTLFWASGLLTDENGEREVSFDTGDITGSFRIILQGITDEEVVSGTEGFLVK